MRLFGLMLGAGGIVTFVHDFTYRRADTAGTGDYELGGWITHAGTDMLIVTVVLATIALAYTSRGTR
jgi:hypothetical protein